MMENDTYMNNVVPGSYFTSDGFVMLASQNIQ